MKFKDHFKAHKYSYVATVLLYAVVMAVVVFGVHH